jgi:uncharacterized protein YbaP (TraB family)
MRHLFTRLLSPSLLLAALFSLNLQAASVWQVSKDGRHFYLAGTVHLLSKQDYPLPVSYDRAFAASDRLVFETDLAELTSAAGMTKLIQQNTLPAKSTLKQHLSAEVYQQLAEHARSRQIPISAFESFKPAFASMMLATVELQRLGAAEAGVDMHYLQLAQQQAKPMSGLETLDEHLAVMTALNEVDADTLIMSALKDMKNIETMLEQMKTAWRVGDISALEQLFQADLKAFPEMYQLLLVKRNHAWMPHLQKLLTQDDVSMVLVGALHMAGDDGLLTLLKQAGFSLKQLND